MLNRMTRMIYELTELNPYIIGCQCLQKKKKKGQVLILAFALF